MRTLLLLLFFFILFKSSHAQTSGLSGRVLDSATHIAIANVTVKLDNGHTDITNDDGKFYFKSISGQNLTITAIGYRKEVIRLSAYSNGQAINLVPQQTQLQDVVITSNNLNPYKAISETDIKLRGVSNSQEVLRIVPGLFIGQHQGGGKAEQIFLRGFDNDHGTDINMSVDGMPINMVSQAHGQGYADSHFIIPETIERTTYKKGMYDAEKGDLAVTGWVDFKTADAIPGNLVKIDAGQFDTYRALAMVNLLGNAREKNQSWYAASEYRFSNSYFDNPQHFNRFNFFTKYHGTLGAHNILSVSASSMYSKWKASGQIPESAVDQGIIGFYGALDPNEGGVTSRTNINAQLITTLDNNDILKNQLYYSRYKFDLHTNFTFYLVDTINGDEIRQREARNLFGYNGSYVAERYLGNIRLTSEWGVNARLDATRGSELSHTINNFTLLDAIKLGDITETGAGAYFSETFHFSPRFTINAGLRFDQFYYRYHNLLPGDSTLNGAGVYHAANHAFSPKLNFYYQANDKAQLYLFMGKGFHSNDARVVVAEKGWQTLPAAYGADVGTVIKPSKNLLLNAAVWYSYLQKEYVYAGDGGTVDFSGRTRRLGFDLSARYQPVAPIYFDMDLNYAHGRAIDDPAGQNYIPLAPVWSSTGGVTYIFRDGFNGSLRYRWLGNRPANEEHSLTAAGYFVNDLVLNYTKKRYEVGLTINNLFNVKWKETQFETLTRLKGEQPVNNIAFTAGTRFFAIGHVAYNF
ncbi:TonB-dependent receptor [Mucilaginibacter sp.]|uniref:TonB-dependent receptor n=1 Tax=Mucilaginibacter sp. TaxID=1882438 RepID=UPI000CAE3113|nr:TonB-dependent receptor [Mucilaginibacter sp.]PLW89584.1 MAG: TonB-dependent receptor [Mucilaginibacter sp.]HEK19525.1 TonB-dependent receptor [Bacteroidota bacterium]